MTLNKTTIVVHCSATPISWMNASTLQQQIDEIRRWHVEERGWSDIGYNFAGGRKGGGYLGARDLDNDGDFAEETGAHVKGYNKETIGYVLIGGQGSSADDNFEDHFTPEQDADLREFIEDMEQRFGPLIVKGHNQYANKACPGFNVPRWLAKKPPKPVRTNLTQSTSIRAAVMGSTTAVSGGVGAITQLEGTNQTVALVFVGIIALAFLYLMKERIRHWGEGLR